ncbi:Bcr/CflA family drug resistance efflux transporter [Vibrio natriegens]|uniref:multidrug effflux MFS transporter n=1 Tax=Vibrio natriegens TaxID=691 RepID=UPI0008040B30|nr:multidrug effflux MFS transporter [Vibrio natriegens]ANQ25135.1 Bcr/CflA family drug resistance efflux transporter [Vibrio natriegens]
MNNEASITKREASPTTGILFMSILGALMAFTSLSTDIYLPAMPTMATELQGDAELTVTGFLIGFAIAQLIWGPISDHIGRRIPLFIGMILFTVGSIGCAMSQNIEQIVFWRVFQALGACTGPMLSRAMIRDLYTRSRAAHMLSTLVIIMAIAPIAGPLLGGQMIKFSTWHSIFWLLAVIGTLMFFSIFYLPETLSPENRTKASLGSAFINYFELFKNLPFMRYTLSLTFYYVAIYAFITGSPFVYIDYFGIDPQHYGWLFAVNIVGVMGMSFVNQQLVHRFRLDTLLKGTTLIATLSIAIMVLSVKAEFGGILMIIIPVFISFSMNGIIAASSTAAALDEIQRNAGSASAVIGSLQYGSGIISTLLLATFKDGTPWTMTWIIGLFTTLSALILWTKRSID